MAGRLTDWMHTMSTNLQIVNTVSLDAGMVLASPHVVDEQSLSDAVATVEADGGLTISAVRYDSDGNAHVEMIGAEESETYARTYPVGTYVRILVDDCRICGTPGTPVGLVCDGCAGRAALAGIEQAAEAAANLLDDAHIEENTFDCDSCGALFYDDPTEINEGLCDGCRAVDPVETVVATLATGTATTGGATYWPGEQADHGFLVGMPDRGRTIDHITYYGADDLGAPTKSLVAHWVRRALRDWGTHAGATLGAWIDGSGTLYLDVCQHYASERDAMIACQNRGELAYWDLTNDREVQADGSVAAADLVAGDLLQSGATVERVERFDGHDETDHTVRVWLRSVDRPLSLTPATPCARSVA